MQICDHARLVEMSVRARKLRLPMKDTITLGSNGKNAVQLDEKVFVEVFV